MLQWRGLNCFLMIVIEARGSTPIVVWGPIVVIVLVTQPPLSEQNKFINRENIYYTKE